MASKVKHVLNVKTRVAGGSANARRLRNTGMIPAVIYSKGITPETVSVDEKEWSSISRHEINLISLVEDGKEKLVLLQEVQHDFIRNKAMHLDFLAVQKDQIITTHVSVHAGHDAPAGVAVGGILDQNIHEVEVACTPDNLPESIEVDVSKIGLGESLHVSQIVAPEGVKILTHGDLVVFLVVDPNSVQEDLPEPAAAPAEGAAAAEPEVIGEKERAEKAAAAAADKGGAGKAAKK